MNTFHILNEIFILKCKGLSDVKEASVATEEYGFAVYFL